MDNVKKNTTMSDTQDTQKKNSHSDKYEISYPKAIAYVVGIVVATAITTLATIASALNSSYFTVISNASRISTIEESIVPRSEFEIVIDKLDERDKRTEVWQEKIENKIDILIEKQAGR